MKINSCFNPQNNRYVHIGGLVRRAAVAEAQEDGDIDGPRPGYLCRTKKPASLMFLGMVCPPIRLKSADYIAVLRERVVP